MWALGIILYQLVSSIKHPFERENFYASIKAIKDNEPAPIALSVSPFIQETIKGLLDKNPETRLETHQLLKNDEI